LMSARFNLGGSYASELTWKELVDLGALDYLGNLPLAYGTSPGRDTLRSAIAKATGVRSEEILVTTGAAGALFLANFVLAGPGDEVVTVTPNFPPTIEAIAASGATTRLVRLSFENGYRLRLADLERVLSGKTALVILVTPGNPSGVALTRAELAAALQVTRELAPQAYVLVDETFRRATFGKASPEASAASWDDRVMTIESLSKCHGAPGLRIGWLVCRDESLRRRIAAAKMGTVISCGTLDETLATLVLDKQEVILAQRATLLERALRLVETWVQDNYGSVEWVKPDAGAFCSVRMRRDCFTDAVVPEIYAAFEARGVKVAHASIFGDELRVFRLGFGSVPETGLSQALALMSDAFAEKRGKAR
jgi:aspartate/methionine/tyrosine aminotransferase